MIYYLISTILTISAFLMGVNIGIKIKREEKIEVIPNIPKKIKEHKETKKEQEELDRFNTILSNIENYDGTTQNQKAVK